MGFGKTTTWAAVLLLGGCGILGSEEETTTATAAASTGYERPAVVTEWPDGDAVDPAVLAALPEAPWQAEPIAGESAPGELLSAWIEADNRDWCAPIAPAELSSAEARPAYYSGGWAVEFDVSGLPGIGADGAPCARCGRGAFGIAGTALMVDDEDPMEAEEHGFRDGSHVRIEAPVGDEEEDVGLVGHVATLKIQGQDCVYQVWSLVGDEHLEELVGRLRFVQPSGRPESIATGM